VLKPGGKTVLGRWRCKPFSVSSIAEKNFRRGCPLDTQGGQEELYLQCERVHILGQRGIIEGHVRSRAEAGGIESGFSNTRDSRALLEWEREFLILPRVG